MESMLEITLPNGVRVSGTASSVFAILEGLGISIDNYYYNSDTNGRILISDMNTYHLKNAILKKYKVWLDTIRSMSIEEAVEVLVERSLPSQLNHMISELNRRREQDTL